MLTHFQFKPLYGNAKLPGWTFSFYYQKQKYAGVYHQNGKIEWSSPQPSKQNEASLTSQVHELMLFHVYDR